MVEVVDRRSSRLYIEAARAAMSTGWDMVGITAIMWQLLTKIERF